MSRLFFLGPWCSAAGPRGVRSVALSPRSHSAGRPSALLTLLKPLLPSPPQPFWARLCLHSGTSIELGSDSGCLKGHLPAGDMRAEGSHYSTSVCSFQDSVGVDPAPHAVPGRRLQCVRLQEGDSPLTRCTDWGTPLLLLLDMYAHSQPAELSCPADVCLALVLPLLVCVSCLRWDPSLP